MQAADIFCLPSYREGFGSSVIEAASCGLPALVSRIYGLTDAVVEGETGWMHSAGNVPDLTSKINFLMTTPFEIEERGKAAQKYVSNNFEEKIITNEMKKFYKNKFYEANN
jgi:glycosyltransferase involved in cell wall biosynthesis